MNKYVFLDEKLTSVGLWSVNNVDQHLFSIVVKSLMAKVNAILAIFPMGYDQFMGHVNAYNLPFRSLFNKIISSTQLLASSVTMAVS